MTSAAIVMVAVFSIFATLSFIEFKQMGVGLAAAILIDATLIRGVLLPATMKLLADRNWYLPGWLGVAPQATERRGAPARDAANRARAGRCIGRRVSELGRARHPPRPLRRASSRRPALSTIKRAIDFE